MQQPNRPTASSRPSDATRRPASQTSRPTVHSQPTASARRPAAGSSAHSSGARPRLTRRQIEMLRRRRRREKIRNIAVLAAVVVAIVAVSAWILRPREEDRTVVARTPVQATEAPTQSPTQTPEATEAPTAEVPSVTDAPSTTDDPSSTALPEATDAPQVQSVSSTTSADGLRSVHFRVTGDLMVTTEQLSFAKKAAVSGYNFTPSFDLIRESLQAADYTMGNLETTIGKYNDKAYSGYPLFNSPESFLDALQGAGYDFFTLANNHMLDRWFDGMKNTVGWVDQYGFDHVGAYRTQEERNTPVVLEIGGIKFGFVAYTHSTNTQEKVCDKAAQEYGVPYLYKADIEGDIKKLRAAGAEVVIAFPHWGDEYVRQPDSTQQKYAKKLAQAGADIILGSHSHTVQPMGYFNITDDDGTQREVFAIFSLGNFLSTHTLQYTDSGIILDFTVQEQADGTFKCVDVGYVPTYCWLTDSSVTIVPSAKYLSQPPEGMDASSYARMKETYQETVSLLDSQFKVLDS